MTETKEIWKPVEGYEVAYEVSDLGRVRNIKRGGRIMTQSKVTHGYRAVHLSKEGKKRSILVHRLVAKAFIPNPDNKPQVNHKDMDKENNRVDNLEWVTQDENLRHAFINKPAEKRKNPWRGISPESKPEYTKDLWRSRLKEVREEKGMTQEELSAATCVKLNTIVSIESGIKDIRSVSIGTASKLAWALSVEITTLFDFDVEGAIKREQAWHRRAAERKQRKKEVI